MEIDVYTDFLSDEEVEHLTGRKKLKKVIEKLNEQGIPFVINAHGKAIVRRDYPTQNKVKPQIITPITTPNENEWMPAVLTN
ncbi:DUF4224 domain-containing protein [Lonepinella koalarum]|uniref:DUF4224 domain-containing protein n=1 Tax=Lonepinella koalarum TaxID=53417 RepID=UPI001E60BC85|nr:DUF4224 domain-containing protein [Lonepinella koalarum]